MTHSKIPHNLTKSLEIPLYKGKTGSEVFKNNLTRQNTFE